MGRCPAILCWCAGCCVGEISNILTAEEAMERLKYNKVNNQISFHTEYALGYLRFVGRKTYG